MIDCVKKNVVVSLVSFLSVCYVFKQCHELRLFEQIILIAIAIFFSVFDRSYKHYFTSSAKQVLDIYHLNKNLLVGFLVLACSLALMSPFSSLHMFLYHLIKLASYLLFAMIILWVGKPAIFAMADATLIAVLGVILFSCLGFISSSTTTYPMWTKWDAGFQNANIPPFFLLSSLAAYFLLADTTRFSITYLAIVLLYIYLDVFSRTFGLGATFLFLLYPLRRNVYFLLPIRFFLTTFTIVGFITITYGLVTSYFHDEYSSYLDRVFPIYNSADNFPPYQIYFFDFASIVRHSYLDVILSRRLEFLTQGLFFTDQKSYFKQLVAFDSIYYEFLLIIGFPSLYFLFSRMNRLIKASNGDDFCFRFLLFSLVISIVGIFEGIFFKFSFISILVFMFLFIDIKSIKMIFK